MSVPSVPSNASNVPGAPSDIRASAVRGLRWTSVKEWVQQGSSMLVLLVLARLLSPADFGTVAIAAAIASILSALREQGFAAALVQRDQCDPLHMDSAYWATLATSALLALLLLIAAPSLAGIYGEPVLAQILYVSSAILLAQAIGSVHGAILQRELQFKRMTFISITSALVSATVAVSFALAGYGLWSMVLQQIAATIVSVPMLWWLSRWRPRLRFSLKHLRELWRFGVYVLGSGLVKEIGRRIDALLLGYLLNTSAVGLYSVGRRVIELINALLMKALGSVTFPTFSRMQNDPQRLAGAVAFTIRMVAFIAFPVFLLTAALAPYIVLTFLGAKWLAGAPVLTLLALGAAIGSVQWIQMSAILAKGRSDWRLGVNIAALALGILAVVVGHPFGIATVAALLAARQLILFPIGAHLAGRLIPLRLHDVLRELSGPLAAAITAAVTAGLVSRAIAGTEDITTLTAASALATGGLAGVLVYLGCAWLFARRQLLQAIHLTKELLRRGRAA
jgi:O-antigen/teichoic acid export membrane protein